MAEPPRIVFLGNPDLAVPPLNVLAGLYRVVLVVTNPDRPAGRRRRPQPTPVKREAERLGLPLWQPPTVRSPEALERIAALRPDFLVVVAYGEILPGKLLALPRLAPLNAHASLLPRHRGPSPLSAAILAGDRETGVSIMRLVKRMDAGPIYLQEKLPIQPDDTAFSLGMRLAPVAARLLCRAVAGIAAGRLEARPQEGVATYCPLLKRGDALIDWEQPAARIERMVRAYYPWPVAHTYYPGKRGRKRLLRLFRARVVEGSAPPGEILPQEGRFLVATGAGLLELEEVQPEGSRRMSGAEFLRGHRLAAGTRLG